MTHAYLISYNNDLNPRKMLFKFDQKKPDFFLIRYAFLVSRSLLTVTFADTIMICLRAFLETATLFLYS